MLLIREEHYDKGKLPRLQVQRLGHRIECIATRLVRMFETHVLRAEKVYLFDEAFLKAWGIAAR